MKIRHKFLLIAGLLNLFTAFLHLIGGQLSLIDPMMETDLVNQVKFELLGAWHMVTIVLFYTSYILIKNVLSIKLIEHKEILSFIGFLYIFFGLPSLILTLVNGQLIPQWILLIPIGILTLIDLKKIDSSSK